MGHLPDGVVGRRGYHAEGILLTHTRVRGGESGAEQRVSRLQESAVS